MLLWKCPRRLQIDGSWSLLGDTTNTWSPLGHSKRFEVGVSWVSPNASQLESSSRLRNMWVLIRNSEHVAVAVGAAPLRAAAAADARHHARGLRNATPPSTCKTAQETREERAHDERRDADEHEVREGRSHAEDGQLPEGAIEKEAAGEDSEAVRHEGAGIEGDQEAPVRIVGELQPRHAREEERRYGEGEDEQHQAPRARFLDEADTGRCIPQGHEAKDRHQRREKELQDLVITARSQASSTRKRFDTEIDSKNKQLKLFRDDVEEMMVAIEALRNEQSKANTPSKVH